MSNKRVHAEAFPENDEVSSSSEPSDAEIDAAMTLTLLKMREGETEKTMRMIEEVEGELLEDQHLLTAIQRPLESIVDNIMTPIMAMHKSQMAAVMDKIRAINYKMNGKMERNEVLILVAQKRALCDVLHEMLGEESDHLSAIRTSVLKACVGYDAMIKLMKQ